MNANSETLNRPIKNVNGKYSNTVVVERQSLQISSTISNYLEKYESYLSTPPTCVASERLVRIANYMYKKKS